MKAWVAAIALIVTSSISYAQSNDVALTAFSEPEARREGSLFGFADVIAALASAPVPAEQDPIFYARALALRNRYIRRMIRQMEDFGSRSGANVRAGIFAATQDLRRSVMSVTGTEESLLNANEILKFQTSRLQGVVSNLNSAAAAIQLPAIADGHELGYVLALRMGILTLTDLSVVVSLGRNQDIRFFQLRKSIALDFAILLRRQWFATSEENTKVRNALSGAAGELRSGPEPTEKELTEAPGYWRRTLELQLESFKKALAALRVVLPPPSETFQIRGGGWPLSRSCATAVNAGRSDADRLPPKN